MRTEIFPDAASLSRAAATHVARVLRETIRRQGRVRLTAATGASQIAFLDALTHEPGVHWLRVELFHLDEYIGLPLAHPASFRRYLVDRLISKTDIVDYHLLDGEGDPADAIARVGGAIAAAPIDIAIVGIGENGHLAFNEPPADFDTPRPFIEVALDDVSRKQQVGEGWFSDLADVPTRAITMSIRQIMAAREIVCVAPEGRKADAVAACFNGPVSPLAPASILQTHPLATLYLDEDSASRLSGRGDAR